MSTTLVINAAEELENLGTCMECDAPIVSAEGAFKSYVSFERGDDEISAVDGFEFDVLWGYCENDHYQSF